MLCVFMKGTMSCGAVVVIQPVDLLAPLVASWDEESAGVAAPGGDVDSLG